MIKKLLILALFFISIKKAFTQRFFPSDTIVACLNDTLYLYLNKNISKNASIKWLTPYASIYNTKKINVTKSPGKYVVYVTDGLKTIKDSTYVLFFPRPIFRIKDTTLCWGKKFTTQVQLNPMYSIRWSTGEEGNMFTTRNAGIYWVEASIGNCKFRDTFQVSYYQQEEKLLPSEVKFCMSEQVKIVSVLKNDPKLIYEWSNGSTGSSTQVNAEGMLYLKTFHPVCGYRKDSTLVRFKACDCEILIPNSFSPNDDNRNDYFFPVLQCDYASYQLTIFDKYGNVLFHTNNPQHKWDGKYKGVPCEEDIYVYKLETIEKLGDKKQVRSGRISLIR